MNKSKSPHLILASQSPQRKKLLTALLTSFYESCEASKHNLKIPPFDIIPADIDETPFSYESTAQVVTRLSVSKALKVLESTALIATQPTRRIIIASDTLVEAHGTIIGKPTSHQNAIDILSSLSNSEQKIYSGYCVIEQQESSDSQHLQLQMWQGFDVATVKFRTLSLQEITAYVHTGEPMDKSGAYAIQGGAQDFVERIDGSLDCIVGLPTTPLTPLLQSLLS